MLAPVIFILDMTALKDLWEDLSRHRHYLAVNHGGCLAFSREEKNHPNGLCHIETANLDGEANPKRPQVLRGFSDLLSGCSPGVTGLRSVFRDPLPRPARTLPQDPVSSEPVPSLYPWGRDRSS
ncbi:Putative phospholipid-transporting ATPase VA [Fukomys damarensis]|uniref:Putative phospholipid-transporting ATPase VA n=1 Tax=Fukomys damarensis TaxID=885580 RepID=A0A091DYL9_FUKDA|nr:Putative phospholipid-transporting ATPase VA [Fukomys damarensis]